MRACDAARAARGAATRDMDVLVSFPLLLLLLLAECVQPGCSASSSSTFGGDITASTSELSASAASVAAPTAAQREWQSTNLRTFHHFDICTFTGCEHNSGTANKSRGSGAPSDFAPTAVNATQWVLAAKALGAGTAVLTARHEGGFALWPTKFSNYSIAHSPYKGGNGDIVMEFVTACRAHGLKPGLTLTKVCLTLPLSLIHI